MPFFDAGSQFLGFEGTGAMWNSAPCPTTRSPPSRSPSTGCSFDPPFNASWDTQAAPALRRDHRARHHRRGAGGLRLRRPDGGFRRAMSICSSARIRWRSSVTTAFCPISTSTMAAAGRSTSRCGTSPARSRASPAGSCWADCPNRVRAYASSGTLRDPGAMAEAAEALPGAGISGAEGALPSRRLA